LLDLLSLQLLLSIIAASGIIAYVADRLGKKLGKKRLSIRVGRLSLRPKHVATLGTVAMGLAVSIITIALVAAASKDARTWLQEGRQLLIQRDRYQKENQELEKKSKELADENQRLQLERIERQKNLQSVRESLAKAEEQRRRLSAEAAGLQADRDRLVAERSRLGGQVASLRRSLDSTERFLAASRRLLALNQSALRQAQGALKTYQAQIRQSKANLQTSEHNREVAIESYNRAVTKSQETFQKLQEALQQLEETQAKVATATAQIADLTTQREQAERDLAATQLQYRTTQARLDKATQNLIEVMTVAESQQGFLNGGYKSSRTEPLTFRAREEVARAVVPGGADTAAAQAALISLIRQARLEAADRGAKSHRAGGQTFEVADIFERQDPKTKTVISSEELKNAVIARAAGRVEDQVLVATSSFNAFAGEPVSLDISVLPNPVIYHQGEMLSEARIDGSLPEEEIFAQISAFLRSRVKERAMEDRMIPKAGTDAPFGVVPSADMFALVRDVKRVGRPVRVQALAQDNIHAADPLRLEFRLK
jgi:uncharacterized protein (DUF3084 family)